MNYLNGCCVYARPPVVFTAQSFHFIFISSSLTLLMFCWVYNYNIIFIYLNRYYTSISKGAGRVNRASQQCMYIYYTLVRELEGWIVHPRWAVCHIDCWTNLMMFEINSITEIWRGGGQKFLASHILLWGIPSNFCMANKNILTII